MLLNFRCALMQQSDDSPGFDLHQPITGDYVPHKCWNFTHGSCCQLEFYSPQYPLNYPNNTECMQLLSAPKGFRIRLDFRDNFHLEHSDGCKYDFLEVRDGPFGYSRLAGRYCGKTHPPMIESTSRFLWLRFKSDDSIEYEGFRAVYNFFSSTESDMEKWTNNSICHIEVPTQDQEGFLSSDDIPTVFIRRANNSGEPIDCTWLLHTHPGSKIFVQWKQYEMTSPQDCSDSFLELYERTTAESDKRLEYCGSLAKHVQSASNHLYVRLFALSYALVPSFKIYFTIFTKGPCEPPAFDCGDGSCINRTLVCNERQNCDHNADEIVCATQAPASTILPVLSAADLLHPIIIGVVCGLIGTVVCISVLVTCRQRRKELRAKQLAMKQEERASLNIEMTDLLGSTVPPTPSLSYRQVATPTNATPPSSALLNHVNVNDSSPGARRSNHVNLGSTGGGSFDRDSLTRTSPIFSRSQRYNRNLENVDISPKRFVPSSFGTETGALITRADRPYRLVNSVCDVENHRSRQVLQAVATIETPPRGERTHGVSTNLSRIQSATSPSNYSPRSPNTPSARNLNRAQSNESAVHRSDSNNFLRDDRDKTSPSPRPDLVQEEKFTYLNDTSSLSCGRSLERVFQDEERDDIWRRRPRPPGVETVAKSILKAPKPPPSLITDSSGKVLVESSGDGLLLATSPNSKLPPRNATHTKGWAKVSSPRLGRQATSPTSPTIFYSRPKRNNLYQYPV